MTDEKVIYNFFQNVNLVGRLTKDPYVGNGFAAFSVAINQSYKSGDGTWKQAPAQFEDVVVFDDDNYRFVQENLYKGVVVEFFGRVQYKERTDNRSGEVKVNRSVVVSPDATGHYLKLATPVTRGSSAKSEPSKTNKNVRTTKVASDNVFDNDAPF